MLNARKASAASIEPGRYFADAETKLINGPDHVID